MLEGTKNWYTKDKLTAKDQEAGVKLSKKECME